jgi:hypothetical protein
MTFRDPLIRGFRTFLQAALGVFLALSTSGMMGVQDVPTLDVLKRALLAASWAGVVALVSFTQNVLEEMSGKRALK